MENIEDVVSGNMECFYTNLKKKIKENGLTQTSFARGHGVNPDWFNRVIRTRSKSLSLHYIMKFASYLDCSPDELFKINLESQKKI